jgi:hypothetical protein
MPAPSERPVDELRERLKALGYLDVRVDRFVLGRSASAERPYWFALAASARIGVLAGVLLGPAAALGLRLRAPELVSGTADALVVSLYLALLFGLAVTLAALISIVIGAALARAAARRPDFPRRARVVAAIAGAGIGLACLAYLTLWWRTTSALGGAESVAWSLAALAVAAAIALLLGHAVGVTILAVLARFGLAAALAPGRPLSSPRVTLPLGLVALGGAMGLLVASGPVARDADPAPPLTVVSPGHRVLAVAIDGIDVATLDRLRAAGQLPAFDALLSGSVARLSSDRDRDPARVWTTIATGQPPERHGIRSLESRQVAGLEGRLGASGGRRAITTATDLLRLTRPAIASSDQRLIPSFWEVAARAGLRTAAMHWWTTWPAPEGLGIVLSDRAILRLERGGALDREVAPADLYGVLTTGWPARRDRAAATAASVVSTDAPEQLRAIVRRSAELDATIADLALDPALGDLDLLTIYLPGLDIAQHSLLSATEGGALTPSELSARVASVEGYYRFLDRTLASLQSGRQGNWLAMLIAQPGRITSSSPGLLAVAGTPAGVGETTAPPTSVAPTVLHALGLPIAGDLPSGPALDLFSESFLAKYPVRAVATYGTRQPLPRSSGSQALDQEMVERLRSLGYVR